MAKKYKIHLDSLKAMKHKRCPCIANTAANQGPEYFCPCDEFTANGECICGVFEKIEE
ncbi:MAG: hypothetical protein WCY37_03565 [Candidatus Dojkabacteria bacterium]